MSSNAAKEEGKKRKDFFQKGQSAYGTDTRKFVVCIRKNFKDSQIRPEALHLEGKIFEFSFGWIADSGIYKGEAVWYPCDPSYPIDAPVWIAEGDLLPVVESGSIAEDKYLEDAELTQQLTD